MLRKPSNQNGCKVRIAKEYNSYFTITNDTYDKFSVVSRSRTTVINYAQNCVFKYPKDFPRGVVLVVVLQFRCEPIKFALLRSVHDTS